MISEAWYEQRYYMRGEKDGEIIEIGDLNTFVNINKEVIFEMIKKNKLIKNAYIFRENKLKSKKKKT